MVAYRRNFTPGGSYFFTVTLLDRRSHLLTQYIENLRTAFRTVKKERPFVLDAVVVLPDHMHCIWTLPPGDADYSLRWREIKSKFSRSIPSGEYRSKGRLNKRERGIWQRRYWEHAIRDERDLEQHMAYIHYNPVKHGYVQRVADWSYSSFHRYVSLGVYPWNWGGVQNLPAEGFGE